MTNIHVTIFGSHKTFNRLLHISGLGQNLVLFIKRGIWARRYFKIKNL